MSPPMASPQEFRDQLAKIDTQIRLLCEERDRIQKKLDDIVYPVLTLPNEITSDIFLQCLLDDTTAVRPSNATAPLLLGMIRRQWRSIALSTHRLWASLDLTSYFSQKFHDSLSMWLSRSGSCPLTLVLSHWPSSEAVFVDDFISVLMQHAHHWSDVEIALPLGALSRLFDDFSGGYPLLKRLQVSETGHEGDFGLCSFSALKTCPKLRELLSNQITLKVPLTQGIPWSQLTRFQGNRFSTLEACEILRNAPSLEEYALESFRDDVIVSGPVIGILPKLRSLKFLGIFRGKETGDFGIFDLVTLPALQKLQFELDEDNASRFSSLISRSSCSLTELRVCSRVDESNFIRCLEALPHLINLSIKTPLPLHTLANNLHRRCHHLPRLKTLRVSVVELGTESQINYQMLVEMLASRRNLPERQGS
ncbi:hypothetical protein DFH06DRAFT_1027112 [Mycena polygramma]|nr:hypothetical protein DFH06DRAFT_1027112 [Mycena polygramma]